MSQYVPAVIDGLSQETLILILSQELERIAAATDYRTRQYANKHITADYNAGGEPYVFADATSGAITVDLPNPNDEMEITVMKIDVSGNAVTLDAGSANINGATTKAITAQYEAVTVYWDNAHTGPQWWIV